MTRDTFVDALGIAVFAIWLGLSFWFFWSASGDYFSRMGAAGAAYAVAYFAFIRHGEIVPATLLQQVRSMRQMQNLHSEFIQGSVKNAALVSVELGETRRVLGLEPSEFSSKMKDLLVKDAENGSLNAEELDALFAETDDAIDAASARVSTVRRRSERTQALVLVLSTLQWGFGDLLV